MIECKFAQNQYGAMIHNQNYLRRLIRGVETAKSDRRKTKLYSDALSVKAQIKDCEITLVDHVSTCKPCNNKMAPLLKRSGALMI